MLLIAVKSCQQHRSYHQAIRDTWGRGFKPLQVIFFMGGTGDTQGDEVYLSCPDDYMSLPHKTKAICQWAGDRYERIFLCDNDTFIRPDEFHRITHPYVPHTDYEGHMNKLCPIGQTAYYKDHMGEYPNCHPWASGGIGYFLSRRAAELVATQTPNVWAEDLWVGQIIGKQVQAKEMTARHLAYFNQSIAWHFARTKKYRVYDPEMMYRSWNLGTPDLMYKEDQCQ